MADFAMQILFSLAAIVVIAVMSRMPTDSIFYFSAGWVTAATASVAMICTFWVSLRAYQIVELLEILVAILSKDGLRPELYGVRDHALQIINDIIEQWRGNETKD